ncbi:3-(cis-5,6-dihydroxycyclohexa-1,3-dien-1-yl)propanoate dehydrogenase [Duganella sp. FT135W]|uniref:3-(Cis-5,6-dihydroxycyclohexa-1, 3-dien-1-yl)propanoate dehydrogenase n=1 Tax=Duganella flavida TaxID=2692175 RepID=A0A6L8KJ53_9BURK|nr:3-(cis-5,6-dihydroxycyclohexa-1,3-dien-1-yl)propanoate dehydrogenase [Duganella flavida]MYM26248.1 3-(cis-5,6-dihydroxycyclohexa-1,3-dien-1-yl)propanoate dehydrogenase [Duganella flavida]
MGWLDNDVALVTGGGSGIGLAVVRRFLAEGARGVGVLLRDQRQAGALQEEFGERVCPVIGDVRVYADHERAVNATVAAYGKLDTLVGNAGVWDFFSSLVKTEPDALAASFDEIFDVNVKGYLLAARAAAAELRKSNGSMIFTLSNASFYAGGGGPVYVASKHAAVGLIKQLAYELAPHVRVNGVAPGGTATPLKGPAALGKQDARLSNIPGFEQAVADAVPLAFMAQPEDHTGHYVLLASRANSRATTAAILQSDGGWEVRGRQKK